MKDIVIALNADADCGKSPIMPYVKVPFDGGEFTVKAKLALASALLRCGFDIFDCNPAGVTFEPAELTMRVNRSNADAFISLSYARFGSGKSFNGACGAVVRYSAMRIARSRTFAEDICAKLSDERGTSVVSDGDVLPVNCPAAKADAGYITNFDDAKLVYDPDFVVHTAERIALGVCEYFDVPYIRRDDISAYPLLSATRRGKKVKLLQCLLDFYGATLPLDGVYGAATDGAVKKLCRDNGKRESGGVTADVWRDLLLLDMPEITLGANGCTAKYLQHKLYSKLYPLELSGKFDLKTLSALNEFLSDSVGELEIKESDSIGADIYNLLRPIGGGRSRII